MQVLAALLASAVGSVYSASILGCGDRDSNAHAPLVDLGYAVHQSYYNATGRFYGFTNIRYGEAPVGDLRFQEPVEPRTVDRSVNNGSDIRSCPQAYPAWLVNQLATQNNIAASWIEYWLYVQDTTIDEDCLFLDVYVPEAVVQSNACHKQRRKLAPVLIWIHGGGYTLGSKRSAGWPTGLLQHSTSVAGSDDGIIFVSINYRLGLFGWLANGDTSANAGLYDQRLALKWVKNHISLFGGDPNRITLMAESAGGSSIMHHLTAFSEDPAKKASTLFSQAIPQSPGFPASLSSSSEVTTETLRGMRESDLINVNIRVVNESFHGTFTFGPTPDGGIVTETPGVLLLQGQFDDRVKLLIGHNLNETMDYVPRNIATNEDFVDYVTHVLVSATQSTINYVTSTLYPNDLSGSYGYETQFARAVLLSSELFLTCNSRYMAAAKDGNAYGYQFAYPPGVHVQDTYYTFYDGSNATVVPELADAMQSYFMHFAMRGDPNCVHGDCNLLTWPLYGDDTVLTFGADGGFLGTKRDPNANNRCAYWQAGEWRGT